MKKGSSRKFCKSADLTTRKPAKFQSTSEIETVRYVVSLSSTLKNVSHPTIRLKSISKIEECIQVIEECGINIMYISVKI